MLAVNMVMVELAVKVVVVEENELYKIDNAIETKQK